MFSNEAFVNDDSACQTKTDKEVSKSVTELKNEKPNEDDDDDDSSSDEDEESSKTTSILAKVVLSFRLKIRALQKLVTLRVRS